MNKHNEAIWSVIWFATGIQHYDVGSKSVGENIYNYLKDLTAHSVH